LIFNYIKYHKKDGNDGNYEIDSNVINYLIIFSNCQRSSIFACLFV